MKLSLIAILAITFASPGLARTVTITGAQGGQAVSTGTCQALSGQIRCNSHIVATGPKGGTATADRTTIFARDQITRSVSGVTGAGRTFGRVTTISR